MSSAPPSASFPPCQGLSDPDLMLDHSPLPLSLGCAGLRVNIVTSPGGPESPHTHTSHSPARSQWHTPRLRKALPSVSRTIITRQTVSCCRHNFVNFKGEPGWPRRSLDLEALSSHHKVRMVAKRRPHRLPDRVQATAPKSVKLLNKTLMRQTVRGLDEAGIVLG